MSKIQISDLQAAGSELFQSSESFLTELQATEANAVYGGKKGKSSKSSKKRSGRGSRRRSGRRSGRNSGRVNILVFPFPFSYH